MEEDHGEMFLSLLATIAVSSGTTAAHKYKHKTKYGLWRKQNEKAISQSILSRILDKFPGGYGQFVCMHFAPFLNEPIQTEDQQQAFETIISFLDDITISIPDDLQEYLTNSLASTDLDSMQKSSTALSAALDDPQGFIASNQEMLKQYQAVMESAEYRASPAYRLKECLNEFQTKIGYQDIFIPAMQRLSPNYRDYYAALQRANDTFKQYFDHGELSN